MFLLQLATSPPSATVLRHLRLKPRSQTHTRRVHFCSNLHSQAPQLLQTPHKTKQPKSQPISQTFHSFTPLKPFLLSHLSPIFLGWLCSAVFAFSLSQLVPKICQFSKIFSHIDAIELRNEGLVLALLVVARLMVVYWQQAFLWEAALSAVHDVRAFVFGRVLERNLGFFDGRTGVSSGDIAYRITAEARMLLILCILFLM